MSSKRSAFFFCMLLATAASQAMATETAPLIPLPVGQRPNAPTISSPCGEYFLRVVNIYDNQPNLILEYRYKDDPPDRVNGVQLPLTNFRLRVKPSQQKPLAEASFFEEGATIRVVIVLSPEEQERSKDCLDGIALEGKHEARSKKVSRVAADE